MAEKTTIARPYAKAVFDMAKEQGNYGEWSDMLQLVAAITNDADAAGIISNPSVDGAKIISMITDVAGDKMTAAGQNLVKLLVENKRLDVASEIAEQYELFRADAEKTIEAEIVSAMDVDAAQQDKIKAALKNRLGREVSLTCKIDQSLIGGAIVRAGDLVIDGSVAGKLQRLATAVSR